MGRKKNTDDSLLKPKAIGPYDIINMIFTDIAKFNTMTKSILAKNYFMVNRVFSIKYPLQAQCFNNIYSDPVSVIRAWASFVQSHVGYGKVPAFVYTKGTKKSSEELSSKSLFSKEEKEDYCLHYNISLKDFDDMELFAHDALMTHMRDYLYQLDPIKHITKTK